MKLFSHGILGMNARNLNYVLAKNTKESISLADSKLKTKRFLASRGIPFAETFAVLKNPQEVKEFSFSSISADGFVIKPNRWSQGRGILIVRRKHWAYLIQGEVWNEDDLRLHMTDILHGSFSLHGSSDSVIIEELLMPWRDFSQYCKHGLADIRVIVYNYVPVTAMVRMPTADSGGKANLAQWGVGLGLGIANGTVVSLFQNRKSYTNAFPAEHARLRSGKLPFWEDILLFSSQVQMYTKLGYLALDWVITENGPKLLEINARAGLEIQNVNLVPLASRLKKIGDLKIPTPEKGVEIAKTLFQEEVSSPFGSKKVLGLEQFGSVNGMRVKVLVDLNSPTSSVSDDVLWLSAQSPSLSVSIESGGRVLLEHFEKDMVAKSTVRLGRDSLRDYLVDPNLVVSRSSEKDGSKWPKEVRELDEGVYEVGRKVNLSSLLKPANYFEALDAFVENQHSYNPIFEYRFPDDDRLRKTRDEVERLREKTESMESALCPIATLYREKLDEIEGKIFLLESYKREDYAGIAKWNAYLFGATDPELLERAREKISSKSQEDSKTEGLLWKILSLEEIASEIKVYFESHGMRTIPIVLENGNLSRVSVSYGRETKIRISKNAIVREKEMPAILAHEIWTHFKRYLSGKEKGLKLFQYWTGRYLADEEGLAVNQSLLGLPEGYEKNAMYYKYYLHSVSDMLSFSETAQILRNLYPEKPIASVFSDAVRLKRWIARTEARWIRWTTFAKDKIYLDGYVRVRDWIANGGNPDELFYWKIKISDLEVIRSL